MGYLFKPEAATDFVCNGFSSFSDYLEAIGVEKDDAGYVDFDKIKTTYAASNKQTETISTQYSEYYTQETGATTYQTWLHSDYPSNSYIGSVRLPFKINGTSPKIILPGTTPHFKNKIISVENTGTNLNIWTLTRTKDSLVLKNQGGTVEKTYYPHDFEDGVIPICVAFIATGSGGGGGSSGGTESGGGGGGGGTAMGIINIATHNELTLYPGRSGQGATHKGGQAYNGGRGVFSYIRANTGLSIQGPGGQGGKSGGDNDGVGGAGGGSDFSSDNQDIITTTGIIQGIYWWDPRAAEAPSLETSSPGKAGGNRGNSGGEFEHQERAITTVNNKTLFQNVQKDISSFRGSSGDSGGKQGGGGGASMDGVGGHSNACGKGDDSKGRDGSYYGGGGAGGSYSFGIHVGGGDGGRGVVELWY